MAAATDVIWQAMRKSVWDGDAGFRAPPLLLDGPPGIGKSSWARFFASLTRVPSIALDASGEGAGFGIIGLQRGWGTAMPGRPVSLILETRVGNPIVIVDELDKIGTQRNTKGDGFSLMNGLLPLLERSTARGWNCPFYQLGFDMSWVSWVFTSNDATALSSPFRSRCVGVTLRELTVDELTTFVLREQSRRQLSDPVTEAMVEALESAIRCGLRPYLRTANRLLNLAALQDGRPEVH